MNGTPPTLAARQRLDLAVSGGLENDSGALIFSAGDLVIGGTRDATLSAGGRAGTINNVGGTIEAQRHLRSSTAFPSISPCRPAASICCTRQVGRPWLKATRVSLTSASGSPPITCSPPSPT